MSVKVLVVDDSALIREVLTRMLTRDEDIVVVGTANDPIEAREKIKILNPDVVTLDIEMPNMNGLQFLEKLMRLRPTPVVMVSTLTKKGASETLLALELGAVDFVAKPSADLTGGWKLSAPTCATRSAPRRGRTSRAGPTGPTPPRSRCARRRRPMAP